MKVIIDNDRKFIAEYKEEYEPIPDNLIVVDINEVPDAKGMKRRFYILSDDNTWFFDENNYNIYKNNKILNSLINLKNFTISQSKQNLENYINSYKLKSTCHKGIEAEYSITSEKQQYLSAMIMTTQMMQQTGNPYQPSWNAAGQSCTYDWTLEELTQLAMEIENVVRPLVSKQQAMEVAINACTTQKEVEAINIEFKDEENV